MQIVCQNPRRSGKRPLLKLQQDVGREPVAGAEAVAFPCPPCSPEKGSWRVVWVGREPGVESVPLLSTLPSTHLRMFPEVCFLACWPFPAKTSSLSSTPSAGPWIPTVPSSRNSYISFIVVISFTILFQIIMMFLL